MASRVLIVGWDAADWQLINPLLDAGQLPHLARLVEGGCIGNLATLYPCLSPLLWNTVATGRTADQHGILSFLEPLPSGTGAQLARSTSRKVKALWNIAAQTGRQSIVCNWYASHPAEPIAGVCISNEAFKSPTSHDFSAWHLPPEAIHPASLKDRLADLRVHPGELTPADLVSLIPRIAEIDLRHDQRPAQLAELLARNLSVHSLFTAALEHQTWDLAAVFYDAIDTAGHLFMPYHPPRLPHVSEHDFELYREVMSGLYRLHDQMLGRLLELAGEQTHVVLLSDHGFQSGSERPISLQQSSSPEAEAAEWHRQYGVLVLHGPQVRADERIYGATLLDVAPTVLALLELPASEEMPGRVLAEALTTECLPSRIPSWEAVPGQSGQHPPQAQFKPLRSEAEVAQLIKLGYLPATAGSGAQLAALVVREQQFNLAAVHLHHGRPGEALPIIEQLVADHPDEVRFLEPLATTWHQLNRPEKCLDVLERLQQLGHRSVNAFLLAAASFGQSGDQEQAEQAFRYAQELAPESALVPLVFGEYLLTQGRGQEAVRQLHGSLQRDPGSPRGWESLARAYLWEHSPPEAEAAARKAIGLRYFSPLAHYCLGVALLQQDRTREAIPAFQTAVKQQPQMLEAHQQLARLYQIVGDPGLASLHLELGAGSPADTSQKTKPVAGKTLSAPPVTGDSLSAAERLSRSVAASSAELPSSQPVIVVTGLPRSGTSLVMQLLQAAGCELLCDDQRPADESNPRGYFEYAQALNLSSDPSCLAAAGGKAIKILYPLVLELPRGLPYRILLVERELQEVLTSQAAMLDRLGLQPEQPAQLGQPWGEDLDAAWDSLASREDCEVLRLEHRALISGRLDEFQRLLDFLGLDVPAEALLAVVRPELYRSRGQAGEPGDQDQDSP